MAWLRSPHALALLSALTVLGACDSSEEPGDTLGSSSEDDFSEDDADDDAQESDDDADEPGDEPDEPGDEPDEPGDDDTDEPEDDTEQPEPEPVPDAVEPCDAEDWWDGESCTTDDGQEGTQYCMLLEGEEVYTPCATEEPECIPGDGWDKGCIGALCYWDGEALRTYSWSEDDCDTPLVLRFDDTPLQFSSGAASAFDLSTDGSCLHTDWPNAPWLALDRDGDGFIRSGAELFGNATAMASGLPATNGFSALAELDSNLDGKITAADARFDELVLWNDFDEDRVGAYAELQPLRDAALSIDLDYGRRGDCDARGNCGFERASFEYRSSRGELKFGEVVDVHLACR